MSFYCNTEEMAEELNSRLHQSAYWCSWFHYTLFHLSCVFQEPIEDDVK